MFLENKDIFKQKKKNLWYYLAVYLKNMLKQQLWRMSGSYFANDLVGRKVFQAFTKCAPGLKLACLSCDEKPDH